MSKQQSRRSVLAALGAAPLAAGVLATAGSAGAEPARTPAALRPGGELDQYVAQLAAEDTFSGTVLLAHRNRTVLERSYGMADRARSVPNKPDTIFNLGSITKMFTAVAIAQLAQQEKLRYGLRLGTYLDGFAPEIAGTVTVHQLLTHTSGLGDFHTPEYFAQAREWDSVGEFWDGTMGFVRRCTLSFPPGSRGQYSNAAFVILGAIVARLSGRSYYDYVREHVFGRAGMSTAGFYTNPQWRADRRIAHPYASTPSGERVDAIDDHLFVGLPAGGAHASARDLVRFANALQGNALLDPVHTWLTTSPKSPIGPLDFEGYGPSTHIVNGQRVLGHNGGSRGVSTNLDWFPDSGWVAVVLSNYDQPGNPGRPAGLVVDKARQLITA